MDKHQRLYNKVLDYAKENNNVRVVLLNGSRVNPNIIGDEYQDFDIVFFVLDLEKQLQDHQWISIFGQPLVKQYKDDQRDANPNEPYYNYMMQYFDGSRLDLTIMRVEDCLDAIREDSLTKVLLDKDGFCPKVQADESTYYIQRPNEKDFNYCVNEFYWLIPYVAKGIARDHLTYALKHLSIIRHELENMTDYWIGLRYGNHLSVGKGKHRYSEFLSQDLYKLYKATYAIFNKENIIGSLFACIHMFDDLAKEISLQYQYHYQENLKNQMIDFLEENYKIKETL